MSSAVERQDEGMNFREGTYVSDLICILSLINWSWIENSPQGFWASQIALVNLVRWCQGVPSVYCACFTYFYVLRNDEITYDMSELGQHDPQN